MGEPSRRRLLATVGIGVAAVAGCAGQDPDGDPTGTVDSGAPGTASPVEGTGEDSTPTGTATSATERMSDSDTSTGGPLDLREANVVDVAVTAAEDGHRFDVRLHHDDAGEDGYANWWQVESLGGERLGRRELLHAHSQQPFTRSETVSIPDGVDCVVVRGHDETHGYGGQAMLVTVETGATRAVGQGSEGDSFADVECPE